MYPNAKEENWPAKAKLSEGMFVIGDGELGEIISDGLRGYICTMCGKTITEAHHIKPAQYKIIYEQQFFYLERHVCDPCIKSSEIPQIHRAMYKGPPGPCPDCGKHTTEWYHMSGDGHMTGDFSKDTFACKDCWEK